MFRFTTKLFIRLLTSVVNRNLGFVFRGFVLKLRGEGVKLPSHCLKLVRIMLETSNLLRKYTRISSFRKYAF